MKWEDFKDNYIAKYEDYVKTEIECPECDEYIIRDNRSIGFDKFPPEYTYFCKNCAWKGRT